MTLKYRIRKMREQVSFLRKNIKKIFPTIKNIGRIYDLSISYSQYGQDLFVKNYFAGKPEFEKQELFFVDIGANDGINLSNTYILECANDQKWRGILIEADPLVYKRCLKNRKSPNVAKYNVALCDRDEEIEFMQIEGPQMLSGIVSEYDVKHLERIENEIKLCRGSKKIRRIQGARFETIMKNHPNIKDIHYLSIDVEGGEMKILQAIDFEKYKIHLVGIEDNYPDTSGISQYLREKGYVEICKLGCDRFFERHQA